MKQWSNLESNHDTGLNELDIKIKILENKYSPFLNKISEIF